MLSEKELSTLAENVGQTAIAALNKQVPINFSEVNWQTIYAEIKKEVKFSLSELK